MKIPLARPEIGNLEIKLVKQCLMSTWISSTGEFINKFEKEFARIFGAKYAISCSNGTAALHLALLALNITRGDEVILPCLTFVATANVITYVGATPVFVDVNLLDWNIDVEQIEKKITSKTKAILPVHLYGYPADMVSIMKLAKKYHLSVIEDAAEAHGATINGKKVGTFGDLGCFSFYGNKIITTGEGGMITTNKKQLMEKIRLLKNHGMSTTRKYWHPVIGYNYRMTNIQAAIGLAQLSQITSFIRKRQVIGEWYRTCLSGSTEIILPPGDTDIYHGVNWLYTILLKKMPKKSRNELILFLRQRGIDSRPTFYPLSDFPMYKTSEKFPASEKISHTGITLPTHLGLSHNNIVYISDTVSAYMRA